MPAMASSGDSNARSGPPRVVATFSLPQNPLTAKPSERTRAADARAGEAPSMLDPRLRDRVGGIQKLGGHHPGESGSSALDLTLRPAGAALGAGAGQLRAPTRGEALGLSAVLLLGLAASFPYGVVMAKRNVLDRAATAGSNLLRIVRRIGRNLAGSD